MTVGVMKDHSVRIAHLDGEGLDYLLALPGETEDGDWLPWADSPVAEGRVDAPLARGLEEDWELLVRPELREKAAGQVAEVLADLESVREETPEELEKARAYFGFEPDGPTYTFTIPADRVEAWYAVLNQARLRIEAEYQFSESEWAPGEMDPEEDDDDAMERLETFWRSKLYGVLQEALLYSMERQFGG